MSEIIVSSGIIVSDLDDTSVQSGGTINSTTIFSYGNPSLAAATPHNEVKIYSAGTLVSSAQFVSGQTLKRGGNDSMYVSSGGTAADTSIDFLGKLFVSSGGTVNGTTVRNWGSLIVSSGGTAADTTVSDGWLKISSGGSAARTIISGGFSYVSRGGTVNGTTVNSGGSLFISNGGTAADTTVNVGGYLNVNVGGTALAIKENGGQVYLCGSGNVTFTANSFNGAVLNNTTATLHSGTTANSTTINHFGGLCVFSGGIANCTTVNSGGNMFISHGGIANSTAVNSGGSMFISYGGIHSGTLRIANGAVVSAYAGATIDFTIAEQANTSTALVNNWSLINGSADANCTITAKTDQAYGTYRLAGGAANFNKTITVKTTKNAVLGILAVGESKNFRGREYTLSNTGGTLSLAVEAAEIPVPARSDVDGNGISDVMFQYTGGDYQIGFWMNGSSTWQGTGGGKPADWTLLGNCDMDQNGMADQVVFGNVLGGAYVGYYQDGNTTDDGWVTIGKLENPNGIVWKNAIGNLTGNEGCNSIVWHAAELGALGVWTDGTDNWVSISGYFDASWEMQGCGDFNGDGKDEVLFTYGGNLYSTDINGNFAALGQGVSGWEVSAIGDFSGDGRDDVVLFHTETGSVMMFENGTTYKSLGQLDASDWFVCGTGDYNGDRKDDLLVRQYSTGMLGYYSSGDMSQWTELGRGIDTNWTVVA